jgi:hypothetical protein
MTFGKTPMQPCLALVVVEFMVFRHSGKIKEATLLARLRLGFLKNGFHCIVVENCRSWPSANVQTGTGPVIAWCSATW